MWRYFSRVEEEYFIFPLKDWAKEAVDNKVAANSVIKDFMIFSFIGD
jgi:hypothetical protein